MRIIICVKCQRQMIKVRSGVMVAELYREEKHIYKLWSADLFECGVCGSFVVSDFADSPIARYPDTEEDTGILSQIAEAKRLGQFYRWPEKRR